MVSAKLYVLFSISVGLLQIFDNVLLARAKGCVTTPNFLVSAMEFGWVIVSLIALFNFDAVPKFLPLSFILFNVAGWICGVYFLRGGKLEDGIITPKNFVLPLLV